jgi:hypothetical protein
MGGLLGYKEVKAQSDQVFGQFGDSKWIPQARINAQLPRNPTSELEHIGLGRTLVLAAMGESTEDNLETLRKYRDKFHLAINDKMFGYFMDRGIKPDFVFLSDANILFKWIEKHVQQTKGVRLISTPYANPDWTKIWQGPRYFYINADVIKSERYFTGIFPDARLVPASSNVSNSMLCFFLGILQGPPVNFGGYEKYLLTGYDYSWRPTKAEGQSPVVKTGKYYAFEDPQPKRFYMNHRTMHDFNGDWVHTSENLYFSARWLFTFITGFGLPVVNCSGRGLLGIPARANLEDELKEINSDPAAIESLKSAHEILKKAKESFVAAKDDFENKREVLSYGRR